MGRAARAIQLLLLLFFLPCAAARANAADDENRAELERYMQAAAGAERFTGAVLVARGGAALFRTAYGEAAPGISNTPATRFPLASITKQFTAAAILQLQEQGRLSVDDPVSRFLPTFPHGGKIRIVHLLTHTSGVRNLSSFPRHTGSDGSLAPYVDAFRNLPLSFEPGQRFQYSNSGYVLLGYLVEKISGERYGDYLRKHVFQPAGMAQTVYDPDARPAVPRGHLLRGARAIATEPGNLIPGGASGLWSTVDDLLAWDRALRDNRVLSKKSALQMFQARAQSGVESGYGFGWYLLPAFGRTMQAHGGSIRGYAAYEARFPLAQLDVVLLSNVQGVPLARMARDLAAIVFGEPYDLPRRPPATRVPQRELDRLSGRYRVGAGNCAAIVCGRR